MTTKRSDITMILDRSGSMRSKQQMAIASFNSFLKTQQETAGDAVFSCLQFNRRLNQLCQAIPFEQAIPLDQANYVPGGGTALLDALGHTITKTKARTAEAKNTQVVIVVITDGMENSSRIFTAEMIRELIQECESNFHWRFVFLAAGPDSFRQHRRYGLDSKRALLSGQSPESYRHSMDLVSRKMAAMRKSGKVTDLEFADEERRAAIDLDNKKNEG